MDDVLNSVKKSIITPELVKSDEPKGVRIVLKVCACYSHDRLTLITKPAAEIAYLLGITVEKLEDSAIMAMFTGRPAVSAAATSRTDYTSVCSAISSASSTSIPRYLTVLSSLLWPSRSCIISRPGPRSFLVPVIRLNYKPVNNF